MRDKQGRKVALCVALLSLFTSGLLAPRAPPFAAAEGSETKRGAPTAQPAENAEKERDDTATDRQVATQPTEDLLPYDPYRRFHNPHSRNKEKSVADPADILVVAAVDGTLAGISKRTGETIWRRASSLDPSSDDDWRRTPEQTESEAPLLEPYVSSTTGSLAGSGGSLSAIPSLDGTVHLMEHSSTKSPDANTVVVTRMTDLIHRAPFVDTRGRLYTGSQTSRVFALDRLTGRVVQVVASPGDASCGATHFSNLDDNAGSLVWLGRLEQRMAIQEYSNGDSNSGDQATTTEFSSGRILSVQDMILEAPTSTTGKSEGIVEHQSPLYRHRQQQKEQQQQLLLGHVTDDRQEPIESEDEEGKERDNKSITEALITTPDGRLAFRDGDSLRWVSSDYFDAPIAFGVDSESGKTVPVTVVPADFLDAGTSYVFPEATAPVLGALEKTGQMFVLPMGEINTASSTAVGSYVGNTCQPGSSSYPECLTKLPMDSQEEPGAPSALTPLFQSDYGYMPPEQLYQLLRNHQQQPSGAPSEKPYRWLTKILGSWLPPTIALIFVLSFELGRRKRQNDTTLGGSKSVDESNVSTQSGATRSRENETGVIEVCHDVILGYGGHGTVVFRGILEGRQVAVKRMLKAYHASADREISLLIESDGHPNVVRYFLKEMRGDFVYLALELCELSLHDLISVLREHRQLPPPEESLESSSNTQLEQKARILEAVRRILFQISCGVRHIHHLRIVHRDLKPANILLADARMTKSKTKQLGNETPFDVLLAGNFVAKISDMGLGKQLVGQSSYGASLVNDSSFQAISSNGGKISHVAGPGSVGWQAPEVMAIRTRTTSSNDSQGDASTEASAALISDEKARTSRSVDIFSLGCIFYSTLVPGCHPFGEWYEREANIVHHRPQTNALHDISADASDLVTIMLSRRPVDRPTAAQVCEHSFFWTPAKRLTFLCEVSDRLESEDAEDRPGNDGTAILALSIEKDASSVVGMSWDAALHEELVSNVQRFRTYDPSSVRALLRLIRNKHHHFDELSDNLKDTLLTSTDGLVKYFEDRFPCLLVHCVRVCRQHLMPDDPLVTRYSIGTTQRQGLLLETDDTTAADKDSTLDGKPGVDQVTDPISVETGVLPGNGGNGKVDVVPSANTESVENVILWFGSTGAQKFGCRGWNRSDDDWVRRVDANLRKNIDRSSLIRCVDDSRFRTRLCNHWDFSMGTQCPMLRKHKCVFAHGPIELRVKEQKRNRWGKLVDEMGDAKNPRHSGGEDTYGAARLIEATRKEEGKWNTNKTINYGKPKNASNSKGLSKESSVSRATS